MGINLMRNRLPNRRATETFDIRHGTQRFHVGIGRFHDGSIAEIFITGPKSGSDLEATARDAAVALSIAAQYGVPLEPIRMLLPATPTARLGQSLAWCWNL
jgi:hypothetical protein